MRKEYRSSNRTKSYTVAVSDIVVSNIAARHIVQVVVVGVVLLLLLCEREIELQEGAQNKIQTVLDVNGKEGRRRKREGDEEEEEEKKKEGEKERKRDCVKEVSGRSYVKRYVCRCICKFILILLLSSELAGVMRVGKEEFEMREP